MLIWGQLNTPSATYDDQLSLSVTFADLKVAYAKKAGYGATSSDWTAEELIAIESDVNSGYRQFLHPPPVAGRSGSYEWSFLRPSATLTAWASVGAETDVSATGVYDSSTGHTTITTTLPVFYSEMAGVNSIVLTGVGTFSIDSFTSSTVVVAENTNATASAVRFSISGITATGVYDGSANTTVTADSDAKSFYTEMVGKKIILTGIGTFVVSGFTSETVITVIGDATASAKTFSFVPNVNATGVYSSTTNITTVTATTASFQPTMVGKNIVLTGVDTFEVHEYTSSTVITILGDATAVAVTFSITSNGNYDLPLDFGGIDGPLTYGADEGYIPVEIGSEGKIRTLRQRNTSASKPWVAAIRPKVSHSGASVQRFELLLEPAPDSDYTFGYRYVANARKLTEGNPFPLGCDQQVHAEALIASVMAVAESRLDDERGIKYVEFIERITAAIAHDERASTPETLGYNADQSGGAGAGTRRDFIGVSSGYLVGYNGSFFP